VQGLAERTGIVAEAIERALTASADEGGRRPAPGADAGVNGSRTPAAPLADCVIWLSESHRFGADSGIGRLAADIRAGRGRAALAWLAAGDDEAARWLDDAGPRPGAETLARIEAGYAPYLAVLRRLGSDPEVNAAAAFAAFDRFRVLAAVHEGWRGLAALNAHLERQFQQALGLPPARGAGARAWLGRPLIVLRNDYLLGLYNGDVGLCLPAAGGELAVFFPQAGGGYRALAPLRLPAHDSAFVLTVHKSQGSEFAEVLLVLPAQAGRVLSRELLYTGVTRAAQRVTLAGATEVFVAGCARATARWSGLADRMRGE
jgi:exodeoxyribonuclease V alpha subunit